ncbi:MAG: apolipoprotein N-acyltransferase [Gammaproteobacteria bacterium]|nr:MAG: apolipoprotein N-acyltransferase [Gammaproteobacteria bacterium]
MPVRPLAMADWPIGWRLAVAFLAGAAMVLAFAPFELGWLPLPLVALLLHLWAHAVRPGEAAALGYAFGLGLFGFGVFWLRNSIGQFGGIVPALALLLTLLFILAMALYFALTGGLIHWLGQGTGLSTFMLLMAPLGWTAVELLRAYLFTGFPWLSLGYSQLGLPLAGYAPVLGVFGVGALVVLSAGCLHQWRRGWPLLILALAWGGGMGLGRVVWTEASGETLEVALVQGNVAQRDKWRPSRFGPSLQRYLQLSEQAPDAPLVVWPETAIAAFDDEVATSVLRPLAQRMQEAGRDLLSGIVVRKADGRYFNAMINLGLSGRQAYFKRHLVPFGEFLPLKVILGGLLDFLEIPMSDFSADPDISPVLHLAGQAVGVDICYEDAFGNEVADALPEAAFLINASNDAWFGDSLAPHQHLEIARMRALETGRELLRATNTGISAWIGADGRVKARSAQFRPALLLARVQPRRGATPYVRWHDWPLILMSGGGLLWIVTRRYRRGRDGMQS